VAKGGKRPGAGRKRKEQVIADALTGSGSRAGLAIREVEGENPIDMILRFMRGESAEHYLWDGDRIVTETDKETGEITTVKHWAPLALKERLMLARSVAPYFASKYAPKPAQKPEAGAELPGEVKDWVDNLNAQELDQLEGLIRRGRGIASRADRPQSSGPKRPRH